MRLWHYKLLPYLPKSQLIAQWRELNSVFKKQDKHILINYIYDYDKANLYKYTMLVIEEMKNRNIQVRNFDNFNKYFDNDILNIKSKAKDIVQPFIHHQDLRYMKQCYYNLEEKFDRGQKDFSVIMMSSLHSFVDNEFKKRDIEL